MRSRTAALWALPLAALLLAAATKETAKAPDPKTETEHVVTAGETLSGIAARAGVPMATIAEANGLSEPYVVRTGKKLVIPRQRTHVVKKGDTGFAIGFQYGVPFAEIARANAIDENDVLQPGQKLIIPALTKTPELAVAKPAPAPTASPAPAAASKEPAWRRPHEGKVILGWKRRPDGGGHEGLDFAVDKGDAVRAAAAGTVIFAGEAPERFGNLVVIDHGGGWNTAYGHLDKVTVKRDEKVRAGERIGLGGSSGDATGTELHFEIRKDGEPLDPAPKLGIGKTR